MILNKCYCLRVYIIFYLRIEYITIYRQYVSKMSVSDVLTARWYDNNTRKSRLAEMKAYAKEVAKHVQDECSVLEVAPGPGYLAIEHAKVR